MDVESGTASQGVATSSKDKISTVSTVPKFANFYHVYALAMAMTLGGIHTDWSYGLQNGFFIFLIGFFVISIGHISLVLCSAEMTGILPFSGGAYGFARVTLGPYIGYIVGYCDAYRCLTYVMRRLFTFGRMMELATDAPHNLQPLFWLLFFIPCILVDSLGSKSFWGLISLFGGVSLFATILYFLAASPKMDFDTYVLEQRDKLDLNVDFEGFLFASLSASRAYLGLAQLTLSCEETKEPRVAVPKAMLASLATVFLLQLCAIFAASSHAPGVSILRFSEYPLLRGFAMAFDVKSSQAILFSIVPVYVTCFGYAFSYGRLVCALSRSGLFPSYGSIVYGERQSPISAMIGGNLLVFVVMVILFVNGIDERTIFASGSMASLVVYASVFVSYLIFRNRFTTLPTTFVNPFGSASAVVGLSVFSISTMYIFGFFAHRVASSIIFIVFIAVISLNYCRIGASQSYSQEEQSILLVLYVMTANRMRKKRNKQKARASFAVLTNSGQGKSSSTTAGSSLNPQATTHKQAAVAVPSPEASSAPPSQESWWTQFRRTSRRWLYSATLPGHGNHLQVIHPVIASGMPSSSATPSVQLSTTIRDGNSNNSHSSYQHADHTQADQHVLSAASDAHLPTATTGSTAIMLMTIHSAASSSAPSSSNMVVEYQQERTEATLFVAGAYDDIECHQRGMVQIETAQPTRHTRSSQYTVQGDIFSPSDDMETVRGCQSSSSEDMFHDRCRVAPAVVPQSMVAMSLGLMPGKKPTVDQHLPDEKYDDNDAADDHDETGSQSSVVTLRLGVYSQIPSASSSVSIRNGLAMNPSATVEDAAMPKKPQSATTAFTSYSNESSTRAVADSSH